MNSLPKILPLLTVASLVSCGTDSPKKPEPVGPVPSALQSGHWHRVKKTPPTYFPTGIPADHPTDFRDGSWVSSGDAQGSQFFIPAHGTKVPQRILIAEAQQAMTPEAREELDRAGKKIRTDDITAKTVEGVSRVLIGAASALGQIAANVPATNYSPPKKKSTPKPPASTPSTPSPSE